MEIMEKRRKSISLLMQTMTMVQEDEVNDNSDDLGEESANENDAIVVSITTASDGNVNTVSVGDKQLLVNQTTISQCLRFEVCFCRGFGHYPNLQR